MPESFDDGQSDQYLERDRVPSLLDPMRSTLGDDNPINELAATCLRLSHFSKQRFGLRLLSAQVEVGFQINCHSFFNLCLYFVQEQVRGSDTNKPKIMLVEHFRPDGGISKINVKRENWIVVIPFQAF